MLWSIIPIANRCKLQGLEKKILTDGLGAVETDSNNRFLISGVMLHTIVRDRNNDYPDRRSTLLFNPESSDS
jgi:hypothetical protein